MSSSSISRGTRRSHITLKQDFNYISSQDPLIWSEKPGVCNTFVSAKAVDPCDGKGVVKRTRMTDGQDSDT
ncbi:hypothetical protein TNCV_78341 [Trichonephila clavipes]|nr:hypothetical protein TNCV_78341 [Trichonephila clavipes]